MSGLSLLMSAARINELIAYMEQTIFSHFMLYRYVLNFERDRRVLEDYKPLYAPASWPIEHERLNNAKTSTAHHFEQQLKQLDEQEVAMKSQFEANRGKLDHAERQILDRVLAVDESRGAPKLDEQVGLKRQI